jgi:hypothetical protein
MSTIAISLAIIIVSVLSVIAFFLGQCLGRGIQASSDDEDEPVSLFSREERHEWFSEHSQQWNLSTGSEVGVKTRTRWRSVSDWFDESNLDGD